MKNKFIILGISLSALLILAFNIIINLQLKNQKIKYKDLVFKESQLEGYIQTLNSLSIYQLQNEGVKIDKATYVEDEKGQKHLLKDLLKSGPKLVFRYSEVNCQTCVESEIVPLINFMAENGNDKVIFLTTYQDRKYLLDFKRFNKIKTEIYNIPENGLGLPIEKLNIPYLFVIDANMQTNLIFIPEKNRENVSLTYYKIVKKQLNQTL